MLRLQASSAALKTTRMNTDTLLYPEKFKENLFIKNVVFVDGEVSIVILTSLFELIECRGKEVLNYINLKCYCDFGASTKSEDIDFQELFEGSESVIFYVKIKSILFEIERKTSDLKVSKVLRSVKRLKLVFDQPTGEVAVEVTYEDNTRKLTRLKDDESDIVISNKKSFSIICRSVSGRHKAIDSHLSVVTKQIASASLTIYGDKKMLPKALLEEDPFEKCPLVRFGSIWTRVVNEKVVIGIPVISQSKR